MKSTFLLLVVFVTALSSCTTAYKTGQTPDDVYYSPAPARDEYVQTEKRDDRQYRNSDDYYDDRYLRMKVQNRNQWSDLDDWYFYGNRYQYTSYNCACYSNPWTPNAYWNNYYNPYYHNQIVYTSHTANNYVNRPRTFNLNSYNSAQLTNNTYTHNYSNSSNNTGNNHYNAPRNGTNTTAPRSNTGNALRDLFRGSSNNSSSTTTNNSSTNTNSSSSNSSSSSSSSSSSGSSAPVRKF